MVLVIELGFGIICGVGAELFERHFQNSIALVVTRNLLLQMSCFFLIRGFTRIFNFVELSKIRIFNFILCLLLVRDMTNFVGSWQRIRF